MEIQPFSFFVKTQKMSNLENLFFQFEKYSLKYYYFQISHSYYLFLFGKVNAPEVWDFFYESLPILEELNTKQRKLRSLRGFLLYALEILETAGEDNIQVLATNLPPLFWKRVKDVIRQNQKGVLLNFLFRDSDQLTFPPKVCCEEILQTLQTEINILKNKVEVLEATTNFLLAADRGLAREVSIAYLTGIPSDVTPAIFKGNFIRPNEIEEEEQLQSIKEPVA